MRISDWSSYVCSSVLNCCIAGNVIAGPTIAITDALAGGTSVDRENPFSYDVYNNFLSTNEIENYGGSAQIDYDLGNLALTSITAYRSEEHTSELQSLMRISYAVFCLQKKKRFKPHDLHALHNSPLIRHNPQMYLRQAHLLRREQKTKTE